MKFYLLAFDPHKTDAVKLHAVIRDNPLFSDWWHFLASTYILVSSSDQNTILNEIYSKWPNQQFFLVEIKHSKTTGWLPKDAWPWLAKYGSLPH